MFALLQAFYQIVMRRLGPEDLPNSRLLLLLTLVAYVTSQALQGLQLFGSLPLVLKLLAIDVALLIIALWVLLWVTSHADRFRQTLTALLGTGTLFVLASIPLIFWRQAFTGPGQQPVGPSIAMLILLVWAVTVQGHIVSRALSSPFAVGLVLSVGYFILNYGVNLQLAPVKP